MRRVNISTLKNNLSAILATLEPEGPVMVTVRNRPVAELRPLPPLLDEDHWARLEREGLIRRPAKRWTPEDVQEFLRMHPPVETVQPANVLQALLEERSEGR
ncbi:MAG: type II toxin-antitoxin system prevent-host-death family antitoxin [Acidobacteria bacterium]|nr:type II toxin-antitoxin system prevent-host-death family antitoxin [Acidobacteriota bacterium]